MNVFITGVTLGLGKELAGEFLHRGYTVWGVGRRYLKESKENFYYSVCDVSKDLDVKRVYEEMKNKNFVPDIIILNAGIMKNDLIPDFSYPIFKEVFDINLFGAINWIDIFLPIFLKNKRGIFAAISSLAAYRAVNINRIAYPGSKAALTMVFQALRVQFMSYPLRFITFQIGRMGERQTLLQVSYNETARKIVNHLSRNKKSDVVDFPFGHAILVKISKHLPDCILRKGQKFMAPKYKSPA